MRTFCFFCFMMFFSYFLISQKESPSFIRDSLDIYIQRGLRDWNIPGCAVAIIKNGKIIHSKGYGYRDLDNRQLVNEHTVFMIASNTKAVTGIALATLEQEKKLSLDDKVSKWLPWFKLYDQNATAMATIKDVVTHRIGFETFQGDFCHWSTSTTRKEVIQKMSKIKPVYQFRDTWGYCNAGYNVAGEIIEKASGLKWEDYVTTYFFKPLNMLETNALTANFNTTSNHCSPHTIYKNKLIRLNTPNIDNLAPATSICSSVSDWSKWLLMLLNEGKWSEKQIIPAKAIKRSMEAISIRGPFNPRFNTGHFSLYGLGWFLQDYNGKNLVSHSGGADGFVTSVTLLPEDQLGILVFTNSDANSFYQSLKWEILDAYLGLPYRNYSNIHLQGFLKEQETDMNWLKAVQDSVQHAKPPDLPLKSYTGNYENEVYGHMHIVQDGKRLKATFEHHPGMHAILEHIATNRFLCTYSNPLFGIKIFPFEIKKKKVKSVMVSCADFVEFTTYRFKRE